MEKFLKVEIGNARFDELKVPFACVATDLLTGERIIFREGDVALAVRASATVPGIFEPVEYRHRYLVDGGLVDNVPTDVARFLGSDFTIAVTAAGDFSKNSVSNVFMVLTQAIYIQGKLLEQKNLGSADIVIQPNVSGVSSINLGSIDECIEEGIDSAKKSVYGLKQKLIDRTSDYYLFN